MNKPSNIPPTSQSLQFQRELRQVTKERDILLAAIKWIASSPDYSVEGAQYIHAAVGALKAISPDSERPLNPATVGASPSESSTTQVAVVTAKAEKEQHPAPTPSGAGDSPRLGWCICGHVQSMHKYLDGECEVDGCSCEQFHWKRSIGQIVAKAAEFGEQFEPK